MTTTSAPHSDVKALLHTIFRYDVPASLVVFLVALPLSIGIAVASGAPVVAGLIAAIVGGIICALVGGSALQVSGPAAGLTVVVAELVATFGWKATCAITAAAGVLQILFGLSRVARAALAIAPIVVHAMLAGIGITIALQQVHVLLGGGPGPTAWQNLIGLPSQLGSPDVASMTIGLIVIAIMLGWKYLPSAARAVPGALVAVVTATLVSYLWFPSVERIRLDGSVIDAIALPALPTGSWTSITVAVLTVALIASVESLLSASAVDKMHSGQGTDFNRELVGQGTANVSSGLLGGLPVTGVIVRSTANVSAGAKTRASAALHGVWLLVFSVFFVSVVEMIPMAALAGLLIVIGIQLVKLAHIDLARRTGELLIYLVTLTSVVFLNLLEGVAIGLALAIGFAAWRIIRVTIEAAPLDGVDGARPRWRVAISGSCSFLALPRLSAALTSVPPAVDVHVDLNVDYIDHAAVDTLREWIRQQRATGADVTVTETGTARMDLTTTAPPRRRTEGRRTVPALRLIWPPQLAGGIDRFRSGIAPLVRAQMAAEHQPHSMLLTCSDARILPNLIVDGGPGEVLNVRNIGNLVPVSHGNLSVESAVEYAVGSLEVSSIAVCGHSGCEAMHDLLSGDSGGSIRQWLTEADESLAALREGHPVAVAARAAGFDEADALSAVNVAVQVERLRTHPVAGPVIADGSVTAIGLFLDLTTARLFVVSAEEFTELGAADAAAEPAGAEPA
ncbi:MAG: bifunctional SulP family inorganic anion transporter/carbonic anhydrase [Actinomycetota bacterium]